MGAVSLIADPARPIKSLNLDSSSLAFAIAGAAIAVLGMGLIAALYDRRLAVHAAGYACEQSELVRKSEEQSRTRNIQLDAALNNMSQALCMFDGQRRLIVCNNNYARLFKLPPELTIPGTHVEAILDHRIALGMFQGEDPKAYRQERLNVVLESVPKNSLLEFPDGRVFSVWYQPMIEGGWVATLEDITETTWRGASSSVFTQPWRSRRQRLNAQRRKHGRRINS